MDFGVVAAAIAVPAVAGFYVQRIRPVVFGAVCLWILVGWVDLERANADLHFEGLAAVVVVTGLAGFAALGHSLAPWRDAGLPKERKDPPVLVRMTIRCRSVRVPKRC